MANQRRVRLVGIATFVELGYLILFGTWFVVTLVRVFSGGGFPGRPLFLAIWLVTVIYVIVAFVLLVVYLRHLNQSPNAPDDKVLWTILLLFLGPVSMSYYWNSFMRPAPATPT
jgi:hypothetical protein